MLLSLLGVLEAGSLVGNNRNNLYKLVVFNKLFPSGRRDVKAAKIFLARGQVRSAAHQSQFLCRPRGDLP